ncbi:hypothetical protein [Xanthobacter tagetidis]|jgi:ElaB/YqjD/DUF883 family membrane-anchored ribosome-binding protein|uniref:DUF3618 domain-containing protein n=1 Tax=Xanthobacter tagetidis TaxID=60216 RepID=A0A3L7AEE5_9HYPH|nr:hypothetical protein [Xanthobacter tagetidis]MBB6308458.1 ElaB/YqjD/DUF883 family membrane-anchored ribosome-binding protein [Xanthobacter tagetidis]RLP78759.1 hypothetical protein D9R14_10945 [Xanthobacter tagetidis]
MAESDTGRAAREALEPRVVELRDEMARLSTSIKDRMADVADDAEEAFHDIRSKASGAVKQAGRKARMVSEAAGEHPGTAAAVLSSAGLMGMLIGFAAGYVIASNGRR